MNTRILTCFRSKAGNPPAKDGPHSLRRRLLSTVLKRLMVVAFCLPGILLLHGATFRYSTSTDTIYVGGGGIAKLTDIATKLRHAPLSLVDTGTNTIVPQSFFAVPTKDSAQITVVSGSTSQVTNTINPI